MKNHMLTHFNKCNIAANMFPAWILESRLKPSLQVDVDIISATTVCIDC
jgi:hypothetical protein